MGVSVDGFRAVVDGSDETNGRCSVPQPPVIDVHRHLVPPALAQLLFSRPEYGVERLPGAEDAIDIVIGGRLFRLSPDFFEIDRQHAAMGALGIDRAVLSLATPFVAPQVEAAAARVAARACNDGFAALLGPGSAWDAWAFLPLQDPAFCAQELERRVAQGFVGGHIAALSPEAFAATRVSFFPSLPR